MWKIVLPVLAALFAVGSSGLVGGPADVDIKTDVGAQNALDFAVAEHNRQSNDVYQALAQEVIKVQKQVVSGWKYTFTVKMGMTPCRKSNFTEQCTIHKDVTLARPYQCTFSVWERPWLNETTLVDNKCLEKDAAAGVGEDSAQF